ncbi:hypothetical protein [Chroogloeocystis siderophila]|jgi:hypothetical protein|nr:hypothetical protein [Chroogloeocystis siderophila]
MEKWSADELRSVNAQIEYRLTEAARKTGRWQESQRHKSNNSQEEEDK